ncbi:MAG TPA: hypothetical protein VKD70_00435 [Candidatus Acidoferrum sp.]|nr:hypothetical protein [Candidatus Acidoferrum sp.]
MKRVLFLGAAFALVALNPSTLTCAQKSRPELRHVGRTVWNLEGGVFFATDGRIPNGACFRINGEVTDHVFFEKLKRIDDENGTKYLRGTVAVTEYPPKLDVSILIHDVPCSFLLKDKTTEPLTKEDVRNLRLRLFWKHGVELRPTARFTEPVMHIRELQPNITPEANDLQKRYEWNLNFVLPSEGVPIEDSLVFVFESADGSVTARTSARL